MEQDKEVRGLQVKLAVARQNDDLFSQSERMESEIVLKDCLRDLWQTSFFQIM